MCVCVKIIGDFLEKMEIKHSRTWYLFSKKPMNRVLQKDFIFGSHFLGMKEKALAKQWLETQVVMNYDDIPDGRQTVFRLIGRGFGTSTCRYRKQWILTYEKLFFFFKEADPKLL